MSWTTTSDRDVQHARSKRLAAAALFPLVGVALLSHTLKIWTAQSLLPVVSFATGFLGSVHIFSKHYVQIGCIGGRIISTTVVDVFSIHDYGFFIWHTLWIRGFDTAYPDKLNLTGNLVAAGEQVSPEGGSDDTKTCGRSRIVDVTAHLLDFNINQLQVTTKPSAKKNFVRQSTERIV